MINRAVVWMVLVCLVSLPTFAAKTAIVIGHSKYVASQDRLTNPKNDAQATAKRLGQLDYDIDPILDVAATPSVQTIEQDAQLMREGMWRDSKTNMIWMRCSLGQTWNGSTCTGEASKHNWQAAQDAVAAMNRNGGYGGYTDWVVPHIEDLASLIHCNTGFEATYKIPAKRCGETTIQEYCKEGYQRPTIDQIIFPNTPDSWYWSASAFTYSDEDARLVGFFGGDTGGNAKGNNFHVRAVRAGHEQP